MEKTTTTFQAKTAIGITQRHTFYGDPNTEDEFADFFAEDSKMTSNEEDLDTTEVDPDFYKLNLKSDKMVDKKYEAKGRFIKNPRKGQPDVMKVFSYFLPNPDGKGSYYVTCTSNESKGKPNIISEAFFAMKDHEVASHRNTAKRHFSRKIYWFSLYQIMEDRQAPELTNMIKIIRYGSAIDKIIDKEEKAGVIINHPRTGCDFNLVVYETTKDGNKFPTYEDSFFDRKQQPISLDGGKTRVNWETDKMALAIHCRDNSPNLVEKVQHVPWSNDLERKIIKTVRGLINDDALFNKIYKNLYKQDYDFAGEGEKATFQGTETSNHGGNNDSAPKDENLVSIDDIPLIEEEKTLASTPADITPKVETKAETVTPAPTTEKVAKEIPAMQEVDIVVAEDKDALTITNEIDYDDI